ncbi:MAG: nitrite reductase small subunit NirD [Akkermansiaceae bacterium]|nr:nitrite reductase small subunit NirD [Akkermansiaceae bacterium]
MSNSWNKVGSISDFPADLGSCVKVNEQQIAVFRIAENGSPEKWYAVQNLNPYNQRMVLSRGIVGCTGAGHKVTCPLHKTPFSLKDGKHLGEGDVSDLKTYPLRVENNEVFLQVD